VTGLLILSFKRKIDCINIFWNLADYNIYYIYRGNNIGGLENEKKEKNQDEW
jgi:hypothetical protein